MNRQTTFFLALTCLSVLTLGELHVSPVFAQTTIQEVAAPILKTTAPVGPAPGYPAGYRAAEAAGFAGKLDPTGAAGPIPRKTIGTPRQRAWLKATVYQRVKIAEKLGEEGARAFAKAKGWTTVFDGTSRGLIQGPDQVYRGIKNTIHVIEAKGGSGQLGHAYGHAQGSSEWAVESAKKVLRHPSATAAERRGAKILLEAASKGKLQVHVVRTSHILGEPTAAVLEQTVRSTDDAARLTQSVLDDLVRGSDDVARQATKKGSLLPKVVLPIAIAVDVGFRVRGGMETERRFEAGEISVQEREVAHTTNVAGMAGGWGGALAGAKLGSLGGGAAGSVVAPGPGTAIGGFVGGVAGGVAGYVGGEAAAKAAAGWTVKKVHSAGTTIANSAEAVWSGTVNAADSAANGVGRAWNWVWGN